MNSGFFALQYGMLVIIAQRRHKKARVSEEENRLVFFTQVRDFFGRNDAKAEIPVLWPPHAKS